MHDARWRDPRVEISRIAATFLLRLLDDSWRRDSQKKFDDEFVDVFKKLRYPFPISRTALAAVGNGPYVAPVA